MAFTQNSRRKDYEILRAQLALERATFEPTWKDLAKNVLPRRSRFFTSDANKGDRRNQDIIDGTAIFALRTLRSGLMSGVTSPARPWFRLSTPDSDMADFGPVKEWLHIVSKRMSTAFIRSNLYNILPIAYGDLGGFGTSAIVIEEDNDDILRASSIPLGSYYIANNHKGRADVFIRDFRMTVRQIVDRFGVRDPKTGAPKFDNFSSYVKNMWDAGQLEAWVDVCQVIKPNEYYDERKLNSKFKKYASCYFERGSSQGTGDEDLMLSEKGYDFFPVLAPRWEVTGEDVYGTSCPALDALGDIKALQVMQKRKAQAVEKMVNPPMKGPTSLRSVKASLLPGDITYSDENGGRGGFTPIHEVNPRVAELSMDIQDTRRQISKAFYEDLFLMLASSDRRQITAREIEERHEEKLLALGPVLEQLNQDLLDPLIDNTFEIMYRNGLLPEPPEELQGQHLKVEYLSIMAQAQKTVGISSVERFLQFTGQMAQFDRDVIDKVDADETLNIYADMISIQPGILRTKKELEEVRNQKAQAQQAAMQNQQGMAAASAAKELSQADTSGDNALTRLMNQGA